MSRHVAHIDGFNRVSKSQRVRPVVTFRPSAPGCGVGFRRSRRLSRTSVKNILEENGYDYARSYILERLYHGLQLIIGSKVAEVVEWKASTHHVNVLWVDSTLSEVVDIDPYKIEIGSC